MRTLSTYFQLSLKISSCPLHTTTTTTHNFFRNNTPLLPLLLLPLVELMYKFHPHTIIHIHSYRITPVWKSGSVLIKLGFGLESDKKNYDAEWSECLAKVTKNSAFQVTFT